MIARSSKWQYIYDISCDVGRWPLDLDNIDRIRFSKWCQFYKRLNDNYDEDERPDERMMWFDVLVDKFLDDDRKRRQKEKTKAKTNQPIIEEGLTITGT